MAAFLLSAGCGPKSGRTGSGPVLATSPADLGVVESPGATANLRLGAPPAPKGAVPPAEFEVALQRTYRSGELNLEVLTGGESLERESYLSSEKAFSLVQAADDGFKPPIDLLRYPVRAGDEWSWKGRVAYAGSMRDAHAEITVTGDKAEVKTEVAFFVATDAGRPELRRRLTFWFRKGKGVARRQFGDVSARYPKGESWQP